MAIFAKVVEGSSFAGAARYFRISPAAVSKHIQATEDRLGVRLLNRTTRRVSPTEIGQEYYDRCVRILAEVDEAEQLAGESSNAPRGHLRVTAPYAFGTEYIVPAVADLLAAYPKLSVDLSFSDGQMDLLEGGFDVAIRTGQLADSSLTARKLCSMPMVLCASPRYLREYGEPHAPLDLPSYDCLAHLHSGTSVEWHLRDRDGVDHVVPITGRFTSNTEDAIRLLALQGSGIACLPCYEVRQDLEADRLARVLPDYTAPEDVVHALYPRGRHMPAKVRVFIDFIAAHLGSASLKPSAPDDLHHRERVSRLRAI